MLNSSSAQAKPMQAYAMLNLPPDTFKVKTRKFAVLPLLVPVKLPSSRNGPVFLQPLDGPAKKTSVSRTPQHSRQQSPRTPGLPHYREDRSDDMRELWQSSNYHVGVLSNKP